MTVNELTPLSRYSVVLVVLFSDSMSAIVPSYSSNSYKLLALIILVPTAFLPLRIISYTSLLSVFSTLFIGVVLIVNGLSKESAPGSLYEFEPTNWWPAGPHRLGISFGIFMAGVGVRTPHLSVYSAVHLVRVVSDMVPCTLVRRTCGHSIYRQRYAASRRVRYYDQLCFCKSPSIPSTSTAYVNDEQTDTILL